MHVCVCMSGILYSSFILSSWHESWFFIYFLFSSFLRRHRSTTSIQSLRVEMDIGHGKIASEKSFKQLLNKHRIKRSQELILSPESICDRFTNPITSNKTFFSPSNGAENYPPNVDCILILEGMCVDVRCALDFSAVTQSIDTHHQNFTI